MSSSTCLFCNLTPDRIILQNADAVAIRDGSYIADGHCFVIPKRHVPDYFGLQREEIAACRDLLHLLRNALLESDPSVTGFLIGVNSGYLVGKTIFHCHIHFIPRRSGDTLYREAVGGRR